MESYESQVVRLNKQLADTAVQLSSKEKQFDTERQTFKEKLESAEERIAELSSEGEAEKEKFKSQGQEYEGTILHLKQLCSELQREVEVARNAQTDSIFLQKGQNDKAADLLREREKLLKQVCFKLHIILCVCTHLSFLTLHLLPQPNNCCVLFAGDATMFPFVQLSVAEREKSDLAQKASDALAEEEILQARISELTAENATVQAEKCDLMSKIKELIEQKAAAESISAELVQEKQSSDTQNGI